MRPETTNSPLWSTLRRLLKSEGVDADSLSIDKLTAALGVGRGSVQRILNGHANLKAETMHKLAERFSVPVSAIAQGTIDPLVDEVTTDFQRRIDYADRNSLSELALHLAVTIDAIKSPETRTKAFAAAVVAIQQAIDQTADADKRGQ